MEGSATCVEIVLKPVQLVVQPSAIQQDQTRVQEVVVKETAKGSVVQVAK